MRRAAARIGIVATLLLLVMAQAPAGYTASAAASGPENCQPTQPADFDAHATVEQVSGDKVTLTYNVSSLNERLVVDLENVGDVTSTTGFTETSNSTYEWDNQTESPSITYDSIFPSQAEYGYIVQLPEYPNATVNTTAIDGIASRELALVGSKFKVYTTSNGCEQIRLVVPCDVNPDEKPRDVIEALDRASEDLDVGHRWSRVTLIAVEDTPPLTNGVYFGHGDMVVEANAEIDSVDNPWIHEYVHSRQGWEATNETEWLAEGSADYLAARLAIEQGIADEEDMTLVAGGNISNQTVLSDPSTWGRYDEYEKGALVVAALDQKMRGDGAVGFEVAMRSMNNDTGNLTQQEMETIIANTASSDTASWYETYTTTSKSPTYSESLPEMGPSLSERIGRRVDGVQEWADRILSYRGHCAADGWWNIFS